MLLLYNQPRLSRPPQDVAVYEAGCWRGFHVPSQDRLLRLRGRSPSRLPTLSGTIATLTTTSQVWPITQFSPGAS